MKTRYRIRKFKIVWQKDLYRVTLVLHFDGFDMNYITYTPSFKYRVEMLQRLRCFVLSWVMTCIGLDIKQNILPVNVMNGDIPYKLDLNLPNSSLSTPQNVKEFKCDKGCSILVTISDNPYLFEKWGETFHCSLVTSY